MSKISGWNFSQHITLADNFKQKSEVLNTWRVGMNDFARIAGGQDSRRNILSPRAFLEFLAKIFTLGYVDFSKRSNEAGRNMMAHIESSSYIKNNDGSEIMNFVMNNPEGERADSSKVIIEISLSTTTTMGTRQGHTAIIFPQSDFLSFRYEGKSFERKDDSSLHLITNKVLAGTDVECGYNYAYKSVPEAVKYGALTEPEEGFKFSDLGGLFKTTGFWYVAFLCLMFYTGVSVCPSQNIQTCQSPAALSGQHSP